MLTKNKVINPEKCKQNSGRVRDLRIESWELRIENWELRAEINRLCKWHPFKNYTRI